MRRVVSYVRRAFNGTRVARLTTVGSASYPRRVGAAKSIGEQGLCLLPNAVIVSPASVVRLRLVVHPCAIGGLVAAVPLHPISAALPASGSVDHLGAGGRGWEAGRLEGGAGWV